MENVTLSADEKLVEAARERARAENTTLNELFQRWLSAYARQAHHADEARAVVAALQKRIHTGGRKFTRDEMNER